MTKTVFAPGTSGPYKFLDYYEERDRATLGGRDQDAMEWASRLAYHRTCVLYGKSGLGKTSLLLAGVFPLLRERGYQPVYVRTLADPTNDLLTSICNECDVNIPSVEGLNDVLRMASSQRTVVIVLDQFEEFFIRFEGSPAVREAFIKAVSGAANDPTLDIRILFSLREDYLARMNDFKRHLPDLLDSAYQLSPLTAFGVRQTITRPLIEEGIEYDQRLVASLVDELARFGFDPPLLQIICSEVYRQAATRTPENVGLSESDLRQVGGIEGVFRKYLDAAVSGIPQEHHLVLRTILDALITADRTKQATTRDALLEGDFVASPEEVGTVLSLLASQRVVRQERRGGQDWYELIHERLVPIILEWLELDQEFFNFRIAKELIANCSRGEAWREQPQALLNEGQLRGVVGPYKERLRLDDLQSEFVLQSALCRGSEDTSYWADRYGYDPSFRILQSLLASGDDTVRLGAAKSTPRVPDKDGRLAETCLALSLRDRNKDVRRAAGGSFALLAQQEHIEALKHTLARRSTRRDALEVLADLLDKGHPLKTIGRLSRWRARLIANRRVLWSNIGRIRQASYSGAVSGLLCAVFWTLTVFASLATLTAWAFGTGTNRIEHYKILGMTIGICLLIAMPLGALIGWRSAVSLTEDFLLSKKLRWGHGIRRDWRLTTLLFVASSCLFLPVLFSYDIEFAVVGSLGLSAIGTYLVCFLSKRFRRGFVVRHSWCLRILLFLAGLPLLFFVLGVDSLSYDHSLAWALVAFICPVVGALGLSVLSTYVIRSALTSCASFNQSFIPSDATHLGLWRRAFIGCVGLPLLVPALLATAFIAFFVCWAEGYVYVEYQEPVVGIATVAAMVAALLGSFFSVTTTVVMAKSVAHVQSNSSQSDQPAVWARRLAVAFPFALIIWYLAIFGQDTIPMLAKTQAVSPGVTESIQGYLGPLCPDADYFKMRFSSDQDPRSLKVLAFGPNNGKEAMPSIVVGGEYVYVNHDYATVISFYGQSQMLTVADEGPSVTIQDYNIPVTSVPLFELQQNQEPREIQESIQLEEGTMLFASCRLTRWEEDAPTEQDFSAKEGRQVTPTPRWEGNFEGKLKMVPGTNDTQRLFLYLFSRYPMQPRAPDGEFVLEDYSLMAIAEKPKTVLTRNTAKQLTTEVLLTLTGLADTEHSISLNCSSWGRVATLDWGKYSWGPERSLGVRVDNNGEWNFRLMLQGKRRDRSDSDKEHIKSPQFVEVIVGLSRDKKPRRVSSPELTAKN